MYTTCLTLQVVSEGVTNNQLMFSTIHEPGTHFVKEVHKFDTGVDIHYKTCFLHDHI